MIGIMQGRLSPSEEMMFFPFDTWEKEFAIAQEIGFDAIEWAFYEKNYEKNPLWSELGRRHIREISKKHGIQVKTLCAGYFIDNTFTGDDAKKNVAILNQLITKAADVGIKIILIPFLGNSEIKNDTEKREIIKNLGECLRTAEQFGVTLAFETTLPSKELKDFIIMFNHSLVKVYYDTGNCTTFVGKRVPEEIRELRNLIAAVHIKDRKPGDTTSYPLGKGKADFPAIFRALKEIHFKGPVTLEAARDKNIDNKTLNSNYLKFINNIIK